VKIRVVVMIFVLVVAIGVALVPLVARDAVPPWTAAVYAMLFVVVLIGLPIAIFLRSWLSSPSRAVKTPQQVVEELSARGLVVSTSFRAKRAFQMEEFEDEGSNYFVELIDGPVLFMNGQHLYDYEAIEGDPEHNQPRRFPCTEFTVHRHKSEGYVVEIVCGGDVLEPEVITPPLVKEDFRRGLIFEDGQIISDRTYDQIKQERMR
jgi:hypothetical protein